MIFKRIICTLFGHKIREGNYPGQWRRRCTRCKQPIKVEKING